MHYDENLLVTHLGIWEPNPFQLLRSLLEPYQGSAPGIYYKPKATGRLICSNNEACITRFTI